MTNYRFNTQKTLKAHYSRGAVVSEAELRAANTPIESLVRLKIISPIEEPKPKPKPKSEGMKAKAKATTRRKST